VATNATGVAAATSWTLAVGANTVVATPSQGGLSFAPTTVSFTATGLAATAFDWEAAGWSWKVLGTNGLPPAPATIDLAVNSTAGYSGPAQAAFSMATPPNTECSAYSTDLARIHSTIFDPSKIIAFRRDFVMPVDEIADTMYFAVDNDFKVFVNGLDKTANVVFLGGGSSAGVVAGFMTHDGCPNRRDFYLPLSGLSAVSNTVVVVALDRGGSTYFDASVTPPPPPIQ
jgi:hypothetical protein